MVFKPFLRFEYHTVQTMVFNPFIKGLNPLLPKFGDFFFISRDKVDINAANLSKSGSQKECWEPYRMYLTARQNV